MHRWIQAQRIGVAAYLYQYGAVPHQELKRFLSHYLVSAPPLDRRKYFAALPPSTLTLLHGLVTSSRGKALSNLLDEIREARLHVSSRIRDARVWAYHTLMGYGDAHRLLLLGEELFGWRREYLFGPAIQQTLEQVLQVLRSPWANTATRCTAIGDLARRMDRFTGWEQIENVLYHHQFCWPLLVMPNQGRSRRFPCAISLPVMLDVDFTEVSSVRLLHADSVLDVAGWQPHMEKAVHMARELWRAKRGNHGAFWRKVQQATVDVDFDVAGQIVSLFAWSFRDGMQLDRGSAEAYFAQAVLSRLLGRPPLVTSAVTGMIGERLLDLNGEPTLNHAFDQPGGIREKLGYAYASGMFERIVFPKTPAAQEIVSEFRKKRPLPASAPLEVIYSHNMHTIADVVQVYGWRQTSYVRVPEVAWGVHTPGAQMGPPGPGVAAVLAALRDNSAGAVMELAATSLDVATALIHLNHWRPLRRGGSHMSLRRPVPGLTWTFIRALPDEQDARFWQLVWRAAGASEEDFMQFMHKPDRLSATRALLSALNRFEPDLNRPSHRSPDVLVIVGANHLKQSAEKMFNPASRPFLAWDILRELNGELSPVQPREWERPLGRTRILLLPAPEAAQPAPLSDLEGLQEEEMQFLEAMVRFQWGFTYQQANRALITLGLDWEHEVRDRVFEAHERRGILRRGQGRYHLREDIRQLVLTRFAQRPFEMAQRAYATGVALAPSAVDNNELPIVGLDASYNPAHFHEAVVCFRDATRLAYRTGSTPQQQELIEQAKGARLHVERYSEVPGWGCVDALLRRYPQHAYDMAQELLRSQQHAGARHHPNHLLYAARAAERAAWVAGAVPGSTEEIVRLRGQAEAFFQQALEHCAYFPKEEAYNRLLVLSHLAFYLSQRRGRDTEFVKINNQALQLFGQLDESPDPEVRRQAGQAAVAAWIELLGDREPDHRKASTIYDRGRQAHPTWYSFWIKAVGAAMLGGDLEMSVVLDQAATDDVRSDLETFAANQMDGRISGGHLREVVDRWEEGIRIWFPARPATAGLALEAQ